MASVCVQFQPGIHRKGQFWTELHVSGIKIDLNIQDPGHPHQTISHPTHIHCSIINIRIGGAELEPPTFNSLGSEFTSQGHFNSLELLNISQFLFSWVVRLKTAPRGNFNHSWKMWLWAHPPISKCIDKSWEKCQPAVTEKQALNAGNGGLTKWDCLFLTPFVLKS